jgi:hypothetical protein
MKRDLLFGDALPGGVADATLSRGGSTAGPAHNPVSVRFVLRDALDRYFNEYLPVWEAQCRTPSNA